MTIGHTKRELSARPPGHQTTPSLPPASPPAAAEVEMIIIEASCRPGRQSIKASVPHRSFLRMGVEVVGGGVGGGAHA